MEIIEQAYPVELWLVGMGKAWRVDTSHTETESQTSAGDMNGPADGASQRTIASVAAQPAGESTQPPDDGEVDELDEEDTEGFWPAVRQRMIAWSSMQPSLRLITAIAFAQLLAAALMIALHSIPSPQINMGLQSGHAIHMSALYFWIGVAFMWVSLSFLLTGALMMRWPVRLLALVLFTGFTLFPGALPSFGWARVAAVIIMWVWALFLTLARNQRRSSADGASTARPATWIQRLPLSFITLALVLGLQAVVGVVTLAATGWTRDPADLVFQLTIDTQLQTLALGLVPFLFLAGSDFAELGQLIGESVAHVTSGRNTRRDAWLALGLTGLVALAIAIMNAPSYPGNLRNTALSYVGEAIVCGAIALVLLGLLRWGRATQWTARLGPLTLLLASLGYIGMFLVVSAVLVAQNVQSTTVTLSDYQVFRTPATQQPAFSLPYPAGWKPSLQSSADETLLTITGFDQQYPGVIFVESHRTTSASADSAAQSLSTLITTGVANGRTLHVDANGVDGAWRTERFTLIGQSSTSSDLAGEGWSRAENGRVWAVVGVTPSGYASVMLPVFQAAVHQWRADRTAQTPAAAEAADLTEVASRSTAIYLGLVPLVVGLALGCWFVRWRDKRSRTMRATGVFLAAFGLILGAQSAPTLLHLLGAPTAWVWYLGLPISNLLQAVAIATLILVGYIALRRRGDAEWLQVARLALTFNIGLLFISLMVNLYDQAIGLSKSSSSHPISWAEGFIVLIALGWDLLMSGEVFTNHNTVALPRHVRLMLYAGYITLTATLVMFFSTQSFTFATETHDAFFESEPWPQLGVHILGLPMVIAAFALALVAWIGRRHRDDATNDSTTAAVIAGPQPEAASSER